MKEIERETFPIISNSNIRVESVDKENIISKNVIDLNSTLMDLLLSDMAIFYNYINFIFIVLINKNNPCFVRIIVEKGKDMHTKYLWN